MSDRGRGNRRVMRGSGSGGEGGEVVLGEDWVSPDEALEEEVQARRSRRGRLGLRRSPLTRRIVTFNLIALNVLIAGILYLNSTRDNLALERARAIYDDAALIGKLLEARLPSSGQPSLQLTDAPLIARSLKNLHLRRGSRIFVFAGDGALLGSLGEPSLNGWPAVREEETDGTLIMDLVNAVWVQVSDWVSPTPEGVAASPVDFTRSLVADAMEGEIVTAEGVVDDGLAIYAVAAPILRDGHSVGVVGVASADGAIDKVVRDERERSLKLFLITTLVSVALSLVLASTIANPISDLSEAAEAGLDRDRRRVSPARVRIPDLTARPDEIGRLSGALRGMVSALYGRIDTNEQFAADVAHEIKNPLASLRSAVVTLRGAERPDQRQKLLDVIEHDVRRLDRLVSDISNASRLDSELVKEEEEEFNLVRTLSNLCEYLGEQASKEGIEVITDMPPDDIVIRGLEPRLAQVFVNLITNAMSFCEDGDAIRVWTRQREDRVLVVVEDTGPGIPTQALGKIFKRFYSERPEGQFGNNSGLGLSISKQIVEAHGGVIWAENIRPTEADITSEPLGARFVVGLPV